MTARFALALHGGAYMRTRDFKAQNDLLLDLLQQGRRQLMSGATGLDVAVMMVAAMEDSGLFAAGKGSGANAAGYVECDAAVMRGRDQAAGAVAAVRRFKNPVAAARVVMEKTPHVLLAGEAGETSLKAFALEEVDPDSYYSEAWSRATVAGSSDTRHGTVGAVICDCRGELFVATSTGGTRDKLAGRVGDTPIIGGGTFADARVAVSCTGIGEFFVRFAAAHDVAARMTYGAMTLNEAAHAVIDGPLKQAGGSGGLIAVDADGNVEIVYNGAGIIAGSTSDKTNPTLIGG